MYFFSKTFLEIRNGILNYLTLARLSHSSGKGSFYGDTPQSTQYRAWLTMILSASALLFGSVLSLQVGREVSMVTTPCSSEPLVSDHDRTGIFCLCPPLSQCYPSKRKLLLWHPPGRVKHSSVGALVSDHDRTGILYPHFGSMLSLQVGQG